MKDYIVTLIAVSLFCGMIELLAPSGSENGLKNHIRLISSLCVLAISLVPIGELISEISNGEIASIIEWDEREELEGKYEEMFRDRLAFCTAEGISKECEQMISEKFEVDEDDINVSVKLSGDGGAVAVDMVTVTLFSGAVFKDPHSISEYLSSLLECECEIIYG